MRWRAIYIVWALAACFLAAAWWWPADAGRSRRGTAGGAAMGIHAPELDAIDHIELVHDGRRWSFDRETDGWWQTAPFRHRMRGELLINLPLEALSLEVLDAMDADAADLPEAAALGLDPPMSSVTLRAGDSNPATLALGRRGMAGRAWARRGGDGEAAPQTLVVDGALHDLLEQEPPETWRDLRFFPNLTVDATRVNRRVSGETLTLVRDGRRWRITAPLPTRADDQFVMQHIAEMAATRGESVMLDAPSSLGAFGLEPPLARITVEEAGVTRTLLVGDRLGGASQARYAMVEGVPSILKIAARDVTRLLGDPTALVDHTGTDVSLPDVSGIRIVTVADDLLLERSLDQWFGPNRGEAIATNVEKLLAVLTTSRASEVMLHDTYPADLEVAVITLLDAAGGPLDTVRVLRELRPPRGNGRWALENGDRVLRVMPEGTEIPLQPADFGITAE
jgi:hypothetical protein